MKTKIFGKEGISEAAEILKQGGLVAFPTETVYGLGAVSYTHLPSLPSFISFISGWRFTVFL